MPGFYYLNDYQVQEYSNPDDPECCTLLHELNEASGRIWLVKIERFTQRKGLFRVEVEHYTLFLDCHGEYQVINLVPQRGTNTETSIGMPS